MDPLIGEAIELHQRFWNDPNSVSIEEAHQAAKNHVDLHFRNKDSCQVMKVTDDYRSWCLENLDLCINGYDPEILDRMYTHGNSLFGAFYDLFGLLVMKDDTCYTDVQIIEEAAKASGDLATIGANLFGFELNYSEKHEHMEKRIFQNKIQDYLDDLTF